MPRYGTTVWNYRPFADALTNAKRFYQLGFNATSYTATDFYRLPPEEMEKLAAFLKETGNPFTVHCLMPDPADAEATAEYRRAAPIMRAFQEKYGLMTGLTFDFWYDRPSLMPILKWTMDLFRDSGTFIALEDFPLDAREAEVLEQAVRPMDAFGVLMDTGHMNLRQTKAGQHTEEAFIAAFAKLPYRVLEVHLHDNLGENDDHRWMGYGTLPLGAVVAGLKQTGFDGIVSVEIIQRGWTLEEGLSYACQTRDAFRALWDV